MAKINLGCGSIFHPDWMNFDINSNSEQVLRYDIKFGIPCPAASADIIYISPSFKFFAYPDKKYLLQECARVLSPNGILRIVISKADCDSQLESFALQEKQTEPEAVQQAVADKLKNLLIKSGFINFQEVSRDHSALSDFSTYGLDNLDGGGERTPDALYIEAFKGDVAAPGINVAMFATWDYGGAGIGTRRQHEGLLAEGVNSVFFVGSRHSSCKGVHVMDVPGRVMLRESGDRVFLQAINEYLKRNKVLLQEKYPERMDGLEFSFPGGLLKPSSVPFYEKFDLIHLQWINGFLNPAEFFSKGEHRPVLWTLRDINPMTGGCHYSYGCRKFEKFCDECPVLGSKQERDITFETWRQRKIAYRELDLHIVCTTNWLAREAKASSLLKKFPTYIIPNSVPVDEFRPLNTELVREGLGIGNDEFVLLFAAVNVSHKRKGGEFVIKALEALAKTPLGEKTTLLLLGHSPSEAYLNTGIKVIPTGFVEQNEHLNLLYNAADAVLMPSLEEAFGKVAAEALACGRPAIAFNAGGVPDLIEHERTGWLAEVGDLEGLINGILWAEANRGNALMKTRCRAYAVENWSIQKISKQYVELYENVLSDA